MSWLRLQAEQKAFKSTLKDAQTHTHTHTEFPQKYRVLCELLIVARQKKKSACPLLQRPHYQQYFVLKVVCRKVIIAPRCVKYKRKLVP